MKMIPISNCLSRSKLLISKKKGLVENTFLFLSLDPSFRDHEGNTYTQQKVALGLAALPRIVIAPMASSREIKYQY